MKILYAILLAIMLTGCTTLGSVKDKVGDYVDIAVTSSENTICDNITMRVYRERYGNSLERRIAYAKFCYRGSIPEVVK